MFIEVHLRSTRDVEDEYLRITNWTNDTVTLAIMDEGKEALINIKLRELLIALNKFIEG